MITVPADRPTRREAPAPRTVESTVSRMAGGERTPVNDPIVPYSVRLHSSTRRNIRLAAIDDERPAQEITEEALLQWLERRERRLRSGNPDAE